MILHFKLNLEDFKINLTLSIPNYIKMRLIMAFSSLIFIGLEFCFGQDLQQEENNSLVLIPEFMVGKRNNFV